MRARRVSALAVGIVFVALSACSSKDDKADSKGKGEPKAKRKRPGKHEPAPPPPLPKGPTSFPELKVTIDGQPLPIHTVQAFWVGPEVVKLELSSSKRGCPSHPTMRQIARGERYFKIWIGKRLDTSGKLAWSVLQTYFGGRTRAGTGASTSVTATPREVGGHVEGTVQLEHTGNARRKRKAQTLRVSGTFDAVVCKLPDPLVQGFRPRDGTMTMEVAGHKARVLGAAVKKLGDNVRIVLSPDMRDCRRGAGFVRSTLKLMLHKGKLRRAVMRGSWFARPLRQDFTGKAPAIKVVPTNDGKQLVTINGSLEIAGYLVALKGNVQALDCSKPAKAKRPKRKNR